jgi:hypothetical protein
MEIWEKVKANVELKDDIEISNKGHLRKVKPNGDYYNYKLFVNSRGYINTLLYTVNGERKNFTLHRLLMLTFIGCPDENMVINHKDGNRLNNKLSNLEWVTRRENSQHAKNITKYNRVKTLTDHIIGLIVDEYLTTDITLNELSVKFNVTRETMRSIINVKSKKILTENQYKKIRNKYLITKNKG